MTVPNTDIVALALQVRETIDLMNDCSKAMREAQNALTECFKRRDSAEAMLRSLKFRRHDNGVWANTEL